MTQLRFNFRAIWIWNVTFPYCHAGFSADITSYDMISLDDPNSVIVLVKLFCYYLWLFMTDTTERYKHSPVNSNKPKDPSGKDLFYLHLQFPAVCLHKMILKMKKITYLDELSDVWKSKLYFMNLKHIQLLSLCYVLGGIRISPWKRIWLYEPFCFNWWLIGRNYWPKFAQITTRSKKRYIAYLEKNIFKIWRKDEMYIFRGLWKGVGLLN